MVVTHDPIEAAALADHVIVIEDGAITQQGPLVAVTTRPRSPWVANMVGLNLLSGTARGTTISLPNGEQVSAAESADGPVFAAFRPNAVTLHRSRPDGSARNLWLGRVEELYPMGDRARLRIEGPVPLIAEVTADAVANLRLADGGDIWAALKATEIDVYPD
jgi:molybdate transport system ATP-binding protein